MTRYQREGVKIPGTTERSTAETLTDDENRHDIVHPIIVRAFLYMIIESTSPVRLQPPTH